MNDTFKFNTPVAIFNFLRVDAPTKIINMLRSLNAPVVILISDGGRTPEEHKRVLNVREELIKQLDWNVKIETLFFDNNVGIFETIGMGPYWVFKKYETCIFLEDDNIPNITFFRYCQEMLEYYKNNEKIFYICGGNFLEHYYPKNGSSYVFTQHMIPSGWASWRDKYTKYYDYQLILPEDKNNQRLVKHTYFDKSLYRQRFRSITREMDRKKLGMRFISWDFHLIFTLRANGLYGISPCENQIENCGIDNFAGHNKAKAYHPNSTRVSSLRSFPLSFPLVHQPKVEIDKEYEKKVEKFMLNPLIVRAAFPITNLIKKITGNYPNRKKK